VHRARKLSGVLVCFAEGFQEELDEFRDPGLATKVSDLRSRLEGGNAFDVGLLLDPIKPFSKRRIGKYRLITREVSAHGQRVLLFCKIFRRSDDGYLTFLKDRTLPILESLDSTASAYVQSLRTVIEPPKHVPPRMSGWLQPLLELQVGAKEEGYDIHETRRWVNQVRRVFLDGQLGVQLLHKVVERVVVDLESHPAEGKPKIQEIQISGESGCYVIWGLVDARTICLLDALVNPPTDLEKLQATSILSGANYKAEVRKAYWSWVAFDSDLWRDIETSEEGNLFLSTDELSLLETLSGVRSSTADNSEDSSRQGLPALISGRAGTGKSTMLAYIFASLMLKQVNDDLDGYPVYVTYNSRLLKQARRTIRGLLRSNAVFRQKVNQDARLRLEAALAKLESIHVVSFHDLLRSYLTPEQRKHFSDFDRVDFADFKSAYLGTPTALGAFNDYGFRRQVSPERAWYIIRQFIKGSGYELDGSVDAENEIADAHAELTEADRQGVTPEDVKAVYVGVYRWYRSELTSHGLWDDQDLVQVALEGLSRNSDDRPKITAIVCDEAQDFTPREIRFLVRCCELLRFQLQNEHMMIPIVLAGDSLQTLSPTGFRWSAVKAILFEEIWAACGKDFVPLKETLENNYRSRDSIVKFCNLIQLNRKTLFPYREDSRDIKPQHAWDSSPSPYPMYFSVGVNLSPKDVREIARSRIVLLPCEEAGERDYIKSDPTLSPLLEGKSDEELTAYLMSSSAAKGQEFPQVFLYNFGRYFKDEGFDMNIAREETAAQFAREFFFNKLYVAASRAGQTLMIIENDPESEGTSRRIGYGHVATLWRDMIAEVSDDERTPQAMLRLAGQYPEFGSEIVVAEWGNEGDWSDAPSAVTPEQAEAFLRTGIEGKDEQTLRRAAAMFGQLGVAYQDRVAEALGHASRLKLDYTASVEYFRRAGNMQEAWTSSLDGGLWGEAAEIRSSYTSAPLYEALLVGMMRATGDDTQSIVDLCSAVAAAMHAGVFRHTRVWLRAQQEIKERVAGLIGLEVAAREPSLVGITLDELRDALSNVAYGASALSQLRAEVGDLLLVARAWGPAIREYSEAPNLSETQKRRLKYARANQQGFPRGLLLLAEAEMYAEAVNAWDAVGSPQTGEWYHVVERALQETGDQSRRFEYAIAMRNFPHALTSLNSPEIAESAGRAAMMLQFVQAAATNFENYGLIQTVITGISDESAVLRNQLIEQLVFEALRRWESPSDFELSFQAFEFRSAESVPHLARNVMYVVMQEYDRAVGANVLDPRWHGRVLEFANNWQAAWELYEEFTRGGARDIRDFCRAGYLRAVHRWGDWLGAAHGRPGFSTDLRERADEKLKIAKEWRLVSKKAQDRGLLYDDELCRDRLFPLATIPPLIKQGAEDYQESGEFSDFFWQKGPRGTLLSYYTEEGLLAWVIDPRGGGSVTEANGSALKRRLDGLFEIPLDKWRIEVRFSKAETRVTIKSKIDTDAGDIESGQIAFKLRV